MPLIHNICSLDDPRVVGYRNLRERDLRGEGVFIVEGALLVERLLRSRFPIGSLFVSAGSEARFACEVQEKAPLYVAEAGLMRQIVGFDFHRGVLGLGQRLPFPDATTLVEQLSEAAATSGAPPGDTPCGDTPCGDTPLQLIVCAGTASSENLGLILRSAAAFGIGAVRLPADGADPLSRRCLRQSMGSALALPIARSKDLLEEVCALRQSAGLRLVAAVAGNSVEGNGRATPLSDFVWPARAVLVVGNEYQGLSSHWLENCDEHVTIPLAPDCDSLNVAVAAGVLLHHMRFSSKRRFADGSEDGHSSKRTGHSARFS